MTPGKGSTVELMRYLALWTYEPTHVFNDANDRQTNFATEIDLLPHIQQCNFLIMA